MSDDEQKSPWLVSMERERRIRRIERRVLAVLLPLLIVALVAVAVRAHLLERALPECPYQCRSVQP